MRDAVFGRKKAEKQFEKLDIHTKKKVITAIQELTQDPSLGTPLTGKLRGYNKYRLGDYRIIYSYNDEKIIVVAIAHRSNVYEEFTRYIN